MVGQKKKKKKEFRARQTSPTNLSQTFFRVGTVQLLALALRTGFGAKEDITCSAVSGLLRTCLFPGRIGKQGLHYTRYGVITVGIPVWSIVEGTASACDIRERFSRGRGEALQPPVGFKWR